MTLGKNIEIFLHPPEDLGETSDQENVKTEQTPPAAAMDAIAPHPVVDRLRRSSTEPDLAARICMDRPVLTVKDCYGTNRKGSIALKEEKPDDGGGAVQRIARSFKRKGKAELPASSPVHRNGIPLGAPTPNNRAIGFRQSTKRRQPKLGTRILRGLTAVFPPFGWVREYKKEWLANDIMSGITAAIFQVPQGLGNGMVSKVPPVMGLYTSFFPAIAYSFLGTSRQTSIGTFTVVALMVGTCVVKYSDPNLIGKPLDALQPDMPNPMTIAISLSLVAGLTQLMLFVLRLGKLGVLISPPLAAGFTAGCAVQILVSQLKGMLGLTFEDPTGPLSMPFSLKCIIQNISKTNPVVAGLSGSVVVTLIIGKDFINPRIQKYTRIPLPWDLIVVIGCVIVSTYLNLEKKYHVPTVKTIPLGLPLPKFPPGSVIKGVLVDGIVIGIVGFIVTFSMALGFGKKYNHKVDANQELLAMGLGNFVGGVFSCTPSCGSLARSSVLESVGCKTQLTAVVCSVVLIVVLYFVGPYLEPLPKCVLATTIGTAVKDYLLTVRQIFKLWPIARPDALVWAITFLAVAILDVSYGLVIGLITALFTITWRMHSYRGVVLREFQSSGIYVTHSKRKNMSLAPESGETSVFRFASPLCFATTGHFERDFERLLALMQRGRRRAVALDCSAMCFVDATGVAIIDETIAKCRQKNIEILFAALPESVVETLDKSGTLQTLGYHNVFLSLQDATRSWQMDHSSLSPHNQPQVKNFLDVDGNMQVTHM